MTAVDDLICPVCKEPRSAKFAFARDGNDIYSCENCAAEFQYPQPSDAVLASIYASTYFLGSEDGEASGRVAELKRWTAALYLDSIISLTGLKTGRMLELGCGSGDFLMEARQRGFTVEGLEYSPHAAAAANERLGYTAVQAGSLETAALPANGFDLLTAFDVIEHVRNPDHALRCVHALLKPGGWIAIVTPSLDSWSHRFLGRHWMEYKTEHLTYFARASLKRLLARTGFTDVQFAPNYKVLSLDYVYRHFVRYPVPLISPVLKVFRKIVSERIAHQHFRMVASGTMALARKSG